MENATSYSISEAAEVLNLSAKTIRRYIKSGKLPSTKVPTKFGDEYRITGIPEDLKQEAAAQAEAQARVDILPSDGGGDNKLDAQQLYQDNIRLAAQLGAATERIRQMEEQLKAQASLLEPANARIKQLESRMLLPEAPGTPPAAPKKPWWKRLFGG
jgi:MerR family transcriptional regulator, copper efflux regulator